jgi:hypothetical protein
MRMGWLVLAVFLGVVGCGGGGGAATYVLANRQRVNVPPTPCALVAGPFSVPAPSTMSFTIDDRPNQEYDLTHIGIIDDATLASSGCLFSVAAAEFSGQGSYQDTSPPGYIPANVYDFIVECDNAVGSCIFDLTWTATY